MRIKGLLLLSLMLLVVCCSEIIKHKPNYVGEAAIKWLERYEANPVDGLNELLSTMFEVGHYFLERFRFDDFTILIVTVIFFGGLIEDWEEV